MNTQASFNDLVNLTDREMQTLLREVDQKDLVVALKGADGKVAKKILANMSERVRAFMKEEVASAGPFREEEVKAVQDRILAQVAQLSGQGQVSWSAGPAVGTTMAGPKPTKRSLVMKDSVKKTLNRPVSQLTLAEIDAVMASIAQLARREGILALEPLLPAAKVSTLAKSENEFLGSALRLAVDGMEPRLIREVMEHWMHSLLHEQAVKYQKVVEGIVSLQEGANERLMEVRTAVVF